MGFPILVRCHLYIESGPRCEEKRKPKNCFEGISEGKNIILTRLQREYMYAKVFKIRSKIARMAVIIFLILRFKCEKWFQARIKYSPHKQEIVSNCKNIFGIMDIHDWTINMCIIELWVFMNNFKHNYEYPWKHNWIMDNHIDYGCP